MSDQDIVGYRIPQAQGRPSDACIACAGEINLRTEDIMTIKRIDATDEGVFLGCDECGEYLDLQGQEDHMAEGLRSARSYTPKQTSTGNVLVDYCVAKGEIEPLE